MQRARGEEIRVTEVQPVEAPPAIELGASPATIVYNVPVPISGWTDEDGKDTWPKNYGGGGYTGPATLREAMKRSQNVSAAQVLLAPLRGSPRTAP